MEVIVVIPAFNEAATVGEVVSEVFNSIDEGIVLVVNDASTDTTSAKAREAGALVLDLPMQLGYWGALQTGLLYGYRKGFRYFVTMDADGQHRASDVPRLLAPLKSGGADVVIGSCPERGGVAKKLAWRFFQILTGLKIKDLTSGFRAYSREAVSCLVNEDLTILDNADITSLILLYNASFAIVEVPVSICERQKGRSKIFSSPFKIAKYMAISVLLSVSKRSIRRC